MDFSDRITKESVKNFILTAENNEKNILEAGRKDDNIFVMDFGYPLSPLQALGICLTSIDNKLGCQ